MFGDFVKSAPQEVAKTLFKIGAVKVNLLNYYQLGSGDYSPLYCDMRALQSDIDARTTVCSRLLATVNTIYPDIDAVVGVASGGISWATTLANNKLLPILYACKYPKDHGLHNQIEGNLPKDGARVIVIDDLLTTGSSALSVVEALRQGKDGKKAEVLGVLTLFDWDLPSVNQKFADANVRKSRLITADTVVQYGLENGLLSEEDKNRIQEFYRNH